MFKMSMRSALLALVVTGIAVLAAAPWKVINNVTIFTPPSSYTVPRTLYARSLVLKSENALLATWENYSPEPPYFPVFRSADGGSTWTPLSNVTDTQNGWGLRYQPYLYELEVAIGSYPAGTILLAGSSIPKDLSITQIELYASQDRGKTWKFVSHIARGGKADPTNGQTPVWEPVREVPFQPTTLANTSFSGCSSSTTNSSSTTPTSATPLTARRWCTKSPPTSSTGAPS